MGFARTVFALVAVWGALTAAARAEDKDVTLKGKIACAKCELKEAAKCQTAIQVKVGGEEMTYYLADKGAGETYHEAVCGGGRKDGIVTGRVSEKDGKRWVAPSKVEYVSAKWASKALRWYTDYGVARGQGQKGKKPLAVFIASGESGWEKLARGGKLTDDVRDLLADKYVPVYVDTSTKGGKELASAFGMRSGLGLVVSDRTGDHQAFRHEGDLGNRDLAGYLGRYADPGRAVLTTETNPGVHEYHQPAPVGVPFQPLGPAPAAAPAAGGCPHCRGR